MLRLTTALAILPAAAFADAHQAAMPAALAGHAILQAETFVDAPADAPAFVQTSGKVLGANDFLRVPGEPGRGTEFPFDGQPVQGFSGIAPGPEAGTYYILTDNGLGGWLNSSDLMLMFHVVRPDWETGDVEILRTTFLSDPDTVVPFPIVLEGSETRYLTGRDFDLEGFQVIGDRIVIGEEFGPYILGFDLESGHLEAFRFTEIDGVRMVSPDYYMIRMGNPGGDPNMEPTVRRSRGYEGLAKSVDERVLYPMLEGPVFVDGVAETVADGRTALRILEMTADDLEWTGRSWLYPVEDPSHAIGDFNMIDETRGLVIERDGGQGDAARACAEGQEEGCFDRPAQFKRVYMIQFGEPGEPVEKLGYIDLLNIADPDGVARVDLVEGVFTFPFVTIEDVLAISDSQLVVANDNNFPYSAGRTLGDVDDNEFILLDAPEFLALGQ